MPDERTDRQSPQQASLGGPANLGPEFGESAEVQADTPPYRDRKGANTGDGEEGVRKAFDAANAPEPGPAPPVSDEERKGTSPTDMNPEPALGVGKSTGSGAEDLAPDRPDVDTKGPAQRPVGKNAENPEDTFGDQGARDRQQEAGR